MSLVLKPEIEPNHASMLTLITAMAVAGGIEKTTGLECKIKWPNDIVIHGKKVCGILTEMSTQMDYINYIVIGIGINVQNEAFPEEIGEVATSLRIESGKKQNRAAIIEAVWEEFETYYDIYLKTEDMQGLVGEYNRKLANMNQQVRVLDPKDPYEGTARGITSKGELIVDTWEARKLVSSGEVSVRGLYGYVRTETPEHMVSKIPALRLLSNTDLDTAEALCAGYRVTTILGNYSVIYLYCFKIVQKI